MLPVVVQPLSILICFTFVLRIISVRNHLVLISIELCITDNKDILEQ